MSTLMNKKEYNVIKLLISFHIEKIHRIVYDKFYFQSFKIRWYHKIVIVYYSILQKIHPDFRAYLKYQKQNMEKDYKTYKLSYLNQIIFIYLIKRNVGRYSEYV